MNIRTLAILIAIVLAIVFLANVNTAVHNSNVNPSITFSDLNKMVVEQPKRIQRLVFVNGSNQVILERAGYLEVKVDVPDDGGKQVLIKNATDHHVSIAAKEKERPSSFATLIVNLIGMFLPIILLLGLFYFMMSRSGAASIQGQLSNSQAQKIVPAADRKTFDDVAGCDEAKQELQEVVDYLRNPGLLAHLGGRPPRGVLLIGPPGNGKTLLAKATAGEANASFFNIAASQFVQMFVGVGASRVRDLFNQARAKRPAIIFIDEIDAVGRQRGTGIGGGHDEREQTLNQLLVEMDGFQESSGIILMAATNRPDVLDEALVRPGRFDRQVLVDHADVNGRKAIFDIHMREKRLANDVDSLELARLTPGSSGADIENVCNEAATVAARRIQDAVGSQLAQSGPFSNSSLRVITDAIFIFQTTPKLPRGLLRWNIGVPHLASLITTDLRNRKTFSEQEIHTIVGELTNNSQAVEEVMNSLPAFEITRADFVEGIDRVNMGVARVSRARIMSREEKQNTSIHELGHALIMSLIEGGDPVTKITIMPRGRALGVTQSLPASDRYGYSKSQLIARILMSMGGRAAQEVVLDTIDTGAQNDFQQAWGIAYRMVTEFGMSKLGPIHVSENTSNPFLGRVMAMQSGCGPQLANAIDQEVRCLVNGCLVKAKELVQKHRDFLAAANEILLQKETLLTDEWQALLKEHGIEPHTVKVNIDCTTGGDECPHK